jgi:hypothetical protein
VKRRTGWSTTSRRPRPERCKRCGNWTIEKDNQPLGPLEGKYEYICKKCAPIGEMVGSLRWKSTSRNEIQASQ